MSRDVSIRHATREGLDDTGRRILLASLSTQVASQRRRPDRRSRPIDFDIDEFTAETREIPANHKTRPLTPRLDPQFGEFEVETTNPDSSDPDTK